jgi:hypothetical protein
LKDARGIVFYALKFANRFHNRALEILSKRKKLTLLMQFNTSRSPFTEVGLLKVSLYKLIHFLGVRGALILRYDQVFPPASELTFLPLSHHTSETKEQM